MSQLVYVPILCYFQNILELALSFVGRLLIPNMDSNFYVTLNDVQLNTQNLINTSNDF